MNALQADKTKYNNKNNNNNNKIELIPQVMRIKCL